MRGQKLLTTVRGRGVESWLTGVFRTTDYPSSDFPDQIMLTWSSDPATGIDIQWRTDTSVNEGVVKYRETGEYGGVLQLLQEDIAWMTVFL